MNKEAWIKAFTGDIKKKANLKLEDAMIVAESAFENIDGGMAIKPEDAVDDELSYWMTA